MRYEDYLKQELVEHCYEKDGTINTLVKQLDKLRENEEINRDILLENVRLKKELEDKQHIEDINKRVIWNLQDQIKTYENCLNALSGNRD